MNESRRPLEILIVEDDEADVRLILEAFKDSFMSHHVSVVEDGVEALAFVLKKEPYLDAARPDVIILDLNMPRKDGREFLADIKKEPGLKDVPVIVFTTSNAPDDRRAAYVLQANCFITKPVEWSEYIAVVKSLEKIWTQGGMPS